MNKQPTRAYWKRQIKSVDQGKDRSKSKRKKRVKRRGTGTLCRGATAAPDGVPDGRNTRPGKRNAAHVACTDKRGVFGCVDVKGDGRR